MCSELRSASFWIESLKLEPHPEGGCFREVYRSPHLMRSPHLPDNESDANRSLCTSIYFLLAGDDFSALHRLRDDEQWFFHAGGPLVLEWIGPDGSPHEQVLGNPRIPTPCFQFMLPADTWFGARLLEPDSYSLTGCVTAPGFDFRDFEMGRREQLLNTYPECTDMIRRLTRIQS